MMTTRKTRTATWLVTAILVLAAPSTAAAGRIYLKSTGHDFRAIVIAEKPTGAAEFAAQELQRYIRAVTDSVLLPIVKETQPNIPHPAILVGPSRLARQLGLDAASLPAEGFALKTTNGYLLIAGNDQPAWALETFTKPEWVFQGDIRRTAGTQVGTLFGVYTFLQEFAGVGWYFPGPLGEVVPKGRDIEVSQFDRTESPAFASRLLGLELENVGELPSPECDAQLDYQVRRRYLLRLRTGQARAVHFNHSLMYWGELFGKEHPEYFALIDGRRSNDWGWNGQRRGGPNRDFCWANPAMIRQQIEEMQRFFQGEIGRHRWVWVYADKQAYPIAANDGTMRPCECPLCRVWQVPGRGYRGSLSDVYAYHLAEVAKAAAKLFPGRSIVGLAYGPRVLPPVKVELPDNVTMCLAFVTPAFMAHPGTREAYDAIVDAWCRKTKVPVMWLYTDAFRYHIPHVPLVLPHAVAREIKARRGKVGGFYFCTGATTTFSQPELYLAGQLMWNPEQDENVLVDRFFRELYGPAAGPVRELYLYLERLWTEETQGFSPPIDQAQGVPAPNWKAYPRQRMWSVVFTPDRIGKALELWEQARRLAAQDPIVSRRLARLEKDLKLAWAESTWAASRGAKLKGQ